MKKGIKEKVSFLLKVQTNTFLQESSDLFAFAHVLQSVGKARGKVAKTNKSEL